MKIARKLAGIVSIFSIAISFHPVLAQDALELLNEVRNKVRHLEKTGQIKRENLTYHEPGLRDEEEYDFIIVGAGSSGSALVYNLVDVSQWKILLLEAGGKPDIVTDIPYWSSLTSYTDLNWNFLTEKEDNFALGGIKEQRMHWPRGKGLGGSSLLNYMVHTRGTKEDYDLWSSLGNPGWSYEDVLPIFKKLENCTIRRQDWIYRGDSGPIQVEDPYWTKAGQTFVAAGENAGYKYVDYNGRGNRGVSRLQASIKNGLRCSAEKCYLRPIRNRKNFTIRQHALVTKVLIDSQGKRARGVEFMKRGKTYRANAKKEVIISAGSIQSPQILLLSGIGPPKQLEKFGIKLIKNLPVGQTLHDHPAYYGLGFTLNTSIIYDWNAALRDEWFIKLYNEGKGMLTDLVTSESLLFTQTEYQQTDTTDIELLFASSFFTTGINVSIGGVVQISDETYANTFKPYEGLPAISPVVLLLQPESSGRIELRSANPQHHPKIYPNFFTDPEGRDMKKITAGIREAIRVVLSGSFDKYGVKVIDKPIYGCQNFTYDSDEYWDCAVRHLTTAIFHPTGTCKMGPRNDTKAVVDHRLKVYGIQGLRVVDASVIPVHISGHTNIPCYMVGEKAAELIKEEYLGIARDQ